MKGAPPSRTFRRTALAFGRLGLIDYRGRIQVHKSLLNVVLLDQLPEHNAEKPRLAAIA
jgi:hypothetical protein